MGQGTLIVDHLEVHVLAHFSHLPGQQVGEGPAVRDRVVIAIFVVSQQRIRHLPCVMVHGRFWKKGLSYAAGREQVAAVRK